MRNSTEAKTTDTVASSINPESGQAGNTGPTDYSGASEPKDPLHPLRTLTLALATIFLAETLVMLGLHYLPPLPPFYEAFVDALGLSIIILPVFILLLYQPMMRALLKSRWAEEVLRESEERFRAICETAQDSIIIKDRDFKYTQVNPATERLFGRPAAEIVGRTDNELFGEEAGKHVSEVDSRVLLGETIEEERTKLVSGDTLKTFHIIKVPIRDSSGNIVALCGIARDITKRKQAEVALQKAYDVINRSPAVAFSWKNKEGWPVEYVSENVRELFGYSVEEFLSGKVLFAEIIHPNDLRMMAEVTRYSDEKGRETFTHKPYRIITKNGKEKWIEDVTQIQRDHDGTITHYEGIVYDITERKQAEKALKENEERYRRITDAITDYIYTVRIKDGQPIDTVHSQACEVVTGYSSMEFKNRPHLWIQMVPEEDQDIVKDQALRILSNVDPAPVEHRIVRRDGSIRWVTSSLVANRDSQGNLLSYDGMVSDITERKQAEEKLRERARQQARAAEFGQLALSGMELDELFEKAVSLVSETLDTKYAKVLEHIPDHHILFLRAGVGWKQGWVGQKSVPDGMDSQGGYTLLQDKPVIAEDVENETRFRPPALLTEHNVVSGITVAIAGHERPFGVLGAHTDRMQRFTRDDAHFLETIANILAEAIQRKHANEHLRSERDYSASIMKSTPTLISSIDPDGTTNFINPAGERITGYRSEEIVGQNWWETLFPGDEYRQVEQLFQDSEKGNVRNHEMTLTRKDGKKRTVIWNSINRLDADGKLELIGFGHDITDRKQAEADRIRLMSAIEQTTDIVVITDLGGTIEYVNPAFERITGYTREEAIGKNPRILKSGKHNDALYKEMWDTLVAGKVWTGQFINKKKDGSLFTEDATISPVRDTQGSITNYVAVKHDITETKRLKELESRAQRLETAGTVAGQVAHDFNNLLAPLMAYPELMREELPKDHRILAYLGNMENAAAQMADINQQLLTLGRRGHYNQRSMNLNEIILQVVEQLCSPSDTLTCETNLDKNLMNIMGGSSQIHRLLMNLVANARDAMQDIGRVTIRSENYYVDKNSIAYGRIPMGEYIKITVSDTGCGIPDDIIQKIFDPFFSSKTADKKRGSGLGLSVVDAVMKDHNGYLDISTRVGEGTSFYLYFPITRETVEGQESVQVIGGSETVLVVDDDDVQREVSLKLLHKLGYNATAVESGEEAVEFLKQNRQDLMIIDMIMPSGIDGTETYRRALEVNPNQKAIIVSGFAESDSVQAAVDLGTGGFVRKPLTRKTIAAAVRRELDREVEVVVS